MATALRPRAFTPIDATLLKWETPISTTLIAGLLLLDEPLDFMRVRDQVAERLLRFDRFRQRPRPPLVPFTLPVWEPVPDFDLDAHLHCTALPEPAGWLQLKTLIEGLLAWPLPHGRPQWQAHLIEHYGSGSAFVICFSHIIADGFASVHLLDALTDPTPDAPPPLSPVSPEPAALPGRLDAALDAVNATLRLPGNLLRGGLDLARDPARAVRETTLRLQMAQALAKYVLMLPDRRTLLRGRSSHCKRIAAAKPIPLSEIKAVGHAFGATVNDVLANTVAGAFRRYLAGRGERVDGLTIHASMPFNLRASERSCELGNGFAPVFMPLPIGVHDPVDRLQVVKRDAGFIKSHPEAPMSFLVLSAIGLIPPQLTRLAGYFFASKTSTVLTNVPGLPEPRYLAGRRLDRVMFWVPTPLLGTMGVSLLTYAGNATVCFSSDAQAVPDIEALVDSFDAEYAELRARAGAQSADAAAPTEPQAVRRADAEPAVAAGSPEQAFAGDAAPPPIAELIQSIGSEVALERCHCRAVTMAGRPCRNYALPGFDYCRTHAHLEVAG